MQVNKFLTLTLIFILGLALQSCERTVRGNGKIAKQQREISSFHALSVKGAYDVYLKNSIEESLTVEADENLMDLISSEVVDSVLIIKNLKTFLRSKKMKLTVCYRDLRSLDLAGATVIKGDPDLMFKDIALSISGAGKVNLDLFCRQLNATISGGADMDFAGKASSVTINMSGAGNINTLNLEADNYKIDISGFGKAKVNVINSLEVNISGAGKIGYKGNPTIKQSITGAGKVYQLP
jgi:hypothetical protein